jgi:hypothetical protein
MIFPLEQNNKKSQLGSISLLFSMFHLNILVENYFVVICLVCSCIFCFAFYFFLNALLFVLWCSLVVFSVVLSIAFHYRYDIVSKTNLVNNMQLILVVNVH